MNFGNIQTADCVNVAPLPDNRCDDPAFAFANPDICPVAPQLIIKPGVALTCAFGSIQFKAFLVKNGAETELTTGVIFSTANPNVAVIGAVSGNATGLTTGETNVTASYQGMTAFAMLSVLDSGCCDAEQVAMMLVVDNSRSMSQAFSSNYSTKLTYARTAAAAFANSVNATKDLIGLMRFNAVDDTVIEAPTSDKTLVASLVPTIPQTQQLTTFYDALVMAIQQLQLTSADRKVIVLISDGVDTTTSYGAGNNPIALLTDFKAQGGIVLCLGVRAAGKGYNLLSALSTGGFFINAYGADEANALTWLSGLKGYICAGNCVPEGDDFENRGVSNYTTFANWNVLDGEVDLLGNGFFDVLPGNGLYVDLIGSPDLNGNFNQGTLQSNATYHLLSGHQYRVTLYLAGNQVANITDHVRVTIKSSSVTVLQQDIFISDYTQGFTPYAFTFTASSDIVVTIEIVQLDHDYNAPARLSGVLLNQVKFEDVTDLVILLNDDFDGENKVYVPPRCGLGTYFTESGYISGYNCYSEGCLDSPPPAQAQDPSPQADIETGFTPPVIYTSTKTACVSCPSGSSNTPENLIPVMTGPAAPSGEASAFDESHGPAWKAFTGIAGDLWQVIDFPEYPNWLRYSFPAPVIVSSYYIRSYWNSVAPGAWQLQGSNDGSTWDVLDSQDFSQDMYIDPPNLQWQVATPAAYLHYRVYFTAPQVPNGPLIVLQLLLYGTTAPTQVCKTATATSDVSQSAADTAAYTQALSDATAELNCVGVFVSTQQFTATCSYGLFPVTRSATASSQVSQAEADANALAAAKILAEAALNCNQSTNGQQITLTDDGPGDPYPSVKAVSDLPGTITKVTVNVNGITHFFADDILLILVSPDGGTTVLMAGCGHAPMSNIDLVFDDAAGSSLPSSGAISAGTYKPTAHGVFPPLDPPGPQPAYGTTLAALNGGNPNGQWALFAMDTYAGFSGSIANWDLTITTA